MKNYEIISMHDLQLFAEGGPAGGAAAETGTGGTGVNAPAAGVQTGVKGNQQTGTPTADGAPAAEVQNPTEQPAVDLNAEFEALIKGKYKEQYNARVTDTVQKRVKGLSEAAEKYRNLEPSLKTLAKNYGVSADDIEALNRAIEDDDIYLEEESLETGKPIKQLREERKKDRIIERMERENAKLRMEQDERKRQEEGQRIYDTWMQQAEAAKLKYPNLDLAVEIQNPQFVDLLRANVGVEAAYQVIHQDDIISGALQAAVRTATQKTVNSVAAGAARPNENGTGQGAATVKPDVSKMTKAQRQEYIMRAARGERIVF